MDTDINSVDSSYESDTIVYNDSSIEDLLMEIFTIKLLLKDFESELGELSKNDDEWTGASKDAYLDLKGFLSMYQKDYLVSVESLDKAVLGLQTLLDAIPGSNLLKEINEG